MARANVPIVKTNLWCPKCEKTTSIFRKRNKQKKAGHKKKLYCYTCGKRTNHIELRDYELKLKGERR